MKFLVTSDWTRLLSDSITKSNKTPNILSWRSDNKQFGIVLRLLTTDNGHILELRSRTLERGGSQWTFCGPRLGIPLPAVSQEIVLAGCLRQPVPWYREQRTRKIHKFAGAIKTDGTISPKRMIETRVPTSLTGSKSFARGIGSKKAGIIQQPAISTAVRSLEDLVLYWIGCKHAVSRSTDMDAKLYMDAHDKLYPIRPKMHTLLGGQMTIDHDAQAHQPVGWDRKPSASRPMPMIQWNNGVDAVGVWSSIRLWSPVDYPQSPIWVGWNTVEKVAG